jgi:hypothetical protein
MCSAVLPPEPIKQSKDANSVFRCNRVSITAPTAVVISSAVKLIQWRRLVAQLQLTKYRHRHWRNWNNNLPKDNGQLSSFKCI